MTPEAQRANQEYRTITIPVHPDEYDVPVSIVHIELSEGRYATIQGPLGRKTMTALHATLVACKDILVSKPEDYSI